MKRIEMHIHKYCEYEDICIFPKIWKPEMCHLYSERLAILLSIRPVNKWDSPDYRKKEEKWLDFSE